MYIFFLVTASVALCNEHTAAPKNKPASWLSLLFSTNSTELDSRPPGTTCIDPDRSTAESGVALTHPFPNLSRLSNPTKLLQAPGDHSKWYVLEKQGRIRVFNNNPAVTSHTLWLDINANVHAASEGGLLGMAFDPDWPLVTEPHPSRTGKNNYRQCIPPPPLSP